MSNKLIIGRWVLIGLALLAALALAPAGVTADGNETAANSTVIHEFSGSDLRLLSVDYADSRAYVTVYADSREGVTVADAGFGGSGSGSFDVTSLHVDGEETIVIELRGDEAVSVSTAQDGFYHEGDVGILTVLQNRPTTVIVQWAVIAGSLGPVFALGLVVTLLRRSHSNTYKELTTEERIKVEKEPVDGFVDRAKRWAWENRVLLAFSGALTGYALLWLLGVVRGPLAIWNALTDGLRVVVLGTVVAALMTMLPVYLLVLRVWEPRKEFVVSADSRDVIESALGAHGGLSTMLDDLRDADPADTQNHGVSIYSGAPERISDMSVTDGTPTESRAPGGKLHIVQSFDPVNNTAVGTWPGLADDIELIAERSKIDGNREILKDESRMLRALLSALPAISIASDTGAARAVDAELRNLLAIDGDPVDSILQRAADGTRFESFYDDASGDDVPIYDTWDGDGNDGDGGADG